MATSKTTDVLIVGAGPTGLALACQLAHLGVPYRIIEKNAHPSTTSKAIGLQYRISEVLAWMGLIDRFVARGHSGMTGGVNCYVEGKKLLTLRMDRLHARAGKDAFAPRGLIIPQSETEAILGEALVERGGRVEWGTAFVEFTQDGDRVVSRLRLPDGSDEEVASKYLVSCEGAHSLVRKQAGFSFAGKTYPMKFFMADVELDWQASRHEVHAWMHPDGVFAAMALPGERKWRLMVDSGKTFDQPTEVTLELVQRLLAERTGDQVVRPSNPTWLTEFKINCRMVDRFRNGRVFLAGDAAHIHSPSGGQGIVTGMQDAYNLSWKLAAVLRDGAPDALLDTYEEERLPAARAVLHATDRNTNVFFGHGMLRQLVRDYLALPLLRLGPVQDLLVREMSQLDKHYRKASLSAHQDGRLLFGARVRAGDRTPDVVFADAATGGRTALFGLLSRGLLVALVGPGERGARVVQALGRLGSDAHQVVPAAGAPQTGSCLVDVHGDFRRLYGAGGEFLYLIRPDGHVGLFQRPINEAALRSYLVKLRPAAEVEKAFQPREATDQPGSFNSAPAPLRPAATPRS